MIIAFFMFTVVCAIGAIITEIKSTTPKARYNVLASDLPHYKVTNYHSSAYIYGDEN